MAGPAFAEGWAGEEGGGEVGEPVRAWVGEPGFALAGGGEEAGEDVEGAAEEDLARGLGGGGELGFFEVGVDEVVDGLVIGGGHFEGPVLIGRDGFFGARGIFEAQGHAGEGDDGEKSAAHEGFTPLGEGVFRVP